MEQEVLKFIGRFTDRGKRSEVIEAFTQGCCYWFAYILAHRFPHSSELVYDMTVGHFGCRIGDRVYDITGDVTDRPWISWLHLAKREPGVAANIFENCINF